MTKLTGREVILHLTADQVRVVLAALNTLLNRPGMFRPEVLETAEDVVVRIRKTLHETG
jgi:hypothetical protein